MSNPISNSARINAAFDRIAAIIRREKHNDASVIRMIMSMLGTNFEFAQAFGACVADTLDKHEAEVDYTEIVIEAYRAALFTYDGCPFKDDPQSAEAFAETMEWMASNQSAINCIISAPRMLQ